MSRSHFAGFIFAAALAAVVATVVPAQAQTFTVLHQFDQNAGDPQFLQQLGTLPQGRDGKIYGASHEGGSSGNGAVFSLTPSGTLSVLANLSPTTGDYPSNGMTRGSDGNFYFAVPIQGPSGYGAIYRMTPSGTLTLLYAFTGGADGGAPTAPPVQGADGNYYGVTTGNTQSGQIPSTLYKVTISGTFTTQHTFTSAEGAQFSSITLGSDGNFYAGSNIGGTNNLGTLVKVTPAGTVTVLHNFAGTDGVYPFPLAQGADGNYYGVTYYGGAGYSVSNHANGVFFQLKPTGAYKALYSFTGGADGGVPWGGLTLGPDGNLYGTTSVGGSNCTASGGCGTIFSFTTAGKLTTLYSFAGSGQGNSPESNLTLSTNGLLYGTTQVGGSFGSGVFYSLNMGFAPFAVLNTTSGKVGTAIGVLGQGFSSSSVVKFNGVASTKVTRTGTTYLTATVPAGATDGYVTVTTGTTTLTTSKRFIVHDSWSSGTAMPTATQRSSAATLGGSIYVIGGANASGTVVSNVQIYNPATNKWTTGTALPAATQNSSAAVVNNVLYVFGGDNGVSTPTNAVWAYNPTSKAWTSMAAMPTARNGTLAVVEGGKVYVMGGNLGGGANFVATVESYNPATNTWATETSMASAKDFPAGGLIGTTIVSADGAPSGSQVTGDTEGYNATTNSWSELAADPTARTGACSGVIGTTLYDASGYVNSGGTGTNMNESFSLSANKWTTTLAPIPQGTFYPASAASNGQLYCFGGLATLNGTAINNVQAYQP